MKKMTSKLFQTALLFINFYSLLLISSTAFTKASESKGSKEEWPAWTISQFCFREGLRQFLRALHWGA